MTRIRTNCPACGEVELRPNDIQLEIVRDTPAGVGQGSCYRFLCPTCTEVVTKPADRRVVHLLATGGVVMREIGVLVDHPEAPPAGPPLTIDDLHSFHDLLQGEDWFHALEAMTP